MQNVVVSPTAEAAQLTKDVERLANQLMSPLVPTIPVRKVGALRLARAGRICIIVSGQPRPASLPKATSRRTTYREKGGQPL